MGTYEGVMLILKVLLGLGFCALAYVGYCFVLAVYDYVKGR